MLVAQEPSAIPVESESHHHVVLENSYVRVLFVEIPPHESTLLHHHDLPYISIPPGGADAIPAPQTAGAQPPMPRVGYAAGGFSHAVNNPGERPIRNIAVELLRPQGKLRNRCQEVLRGQASDTCEPMNLDIVRFYKLPAFETDELLVEGWLVGANVYSKSMKFSHDMLVAGPIGVKISAGPGMNSDTSPHGILWIPAHTKMTFQTDSDRGGRFYSITFKDSGSAKQ